MIAGSVSIQVLQGNHWIILEAAAEDPNHSEQLHSDYCLSKDSLLLSQRNASPARPEEAMIET
jgi:hypothetical protein